MPLLMFLGPPGELVAAARLLGAAQMAMPVPGARSATGEEQIPEVKQAGTLGLQVEAGPSPASAMLDAFSGSGNSFVDPGGAAGEVSVEAGTLGPRLVEDVGVQAKIMLTVMDDDGNEGCSSIKKSTPLRNLFDAYCRRKRLWGSQVQFGLNGNRIAPDDTAEALGVDEADIIDAEWITG